MARIRKVRTDSWVAQLTQDQQYELYDKSQQPNMHWIKAMKWAVKEFGLKKLPSQTAFYQWKSDMRKEDLRERIVSVMLSTRRFYGLVPDDEIVATFKVLATEAALSGDAKTATDLVKCAASVHDHYIKQSEFEHRESDRTAKQIAAKMANETIGKQYALLKEKLLKVCTTELEWDHEDIRQKRIAEGKTTEPQPPPQPPENPADTPSTTS